MSSVVPRYGGRDGTWDYDYGPWNYGDTKEVEGGDDDELPMVDYSDIAYDEWTIKMSLRSDGLPQSLWDVVLVRREGPLLRMVGDELRFDTLLYRMVLSRSAHDDFDREVVELYYGFLKEIKKSGVLLVYFDVSDKLMWDIALWGAYFIMCPYYEYEVIELDEYGYYAQRPDDSDRDIEP